MNRIVLTLILLSSIILNAQASNREDNLKAVVNRLSGAFEKGNTEEMINDFSTRFAISVASYPQSVTNYLSPLLEGKAIKNIEYQSIISEGDTTYVNAKFTMKDGKISESKIAFDKENKLLYVEQFDKLFGKDRNNESKLVATIPFTQDGESIILSLKLNEYDKPLKFLLDTGADGTAVNAKVGEEAGLNVSHTNEASVVGGTIKTSITTNNTVHLSDQLSLQRQRIAIINGLNDKYDGIIGLNIAREYIVNINFETKEISLYTFGNHTFETKGHNFNISIPNGVILIPGILNIVGKKDVPGNFVFDSGANYHLIGFERFVRKNRLLLTGFKPEGQASTVSMGIVSPIFYGKATRFKFAEDIIFEDMPISLQASSAGGANIADDIPDGSIGIGLISQFNVTIDLLRKIIHLTPR